MPPDYNLLDIKTSKCTVATTLSLSCLQAWSYLFHVAIRRGHETMIRRARVFFRAAFLRTDITLASMASTYEGQSQRHCILDIDGEKMRWA